VFDFLDDEVTSGNGMATQISNPEKIASLKIPSTMRAVVYRGINDMRVETVPVPAIGPGELLIKVATCGICGTDLKKIHHGLARGAAYLRPRDGRDYRPGGRGVTSTPLATGDDIHHVPCGECYYCRKRTPAQCRSI